MKIMNTKRVVVTGIGAVTPIGNDVDTFWTNCVAGVNGIGEVTKFDVTEFKAKLAAEVKDFEPEKYMAKGEVRRNDLMTQYAVAAASQAVEDSGIMDNIEPENFGVYIGSGIGGINTTTTEHKKLLEQGPRRISPFMVPMMIINMAAGVVAMKFKAQGVCLPVVTACASGTTAIGEAYRAIKDGYAEAIIAGGSEAAVTPLSFGGFVACQALSLSTDVNRASIPFDKERNGFIMGEGSGVMVLEEYEHAKARGAKIYAEVVGYGNTCDAHHVTAPEPEAKCSTKCIVQAVKGTDIAIDESLYINTHGTSTPLNDKTETRAIKQAFGDDAYKVHISSTKSMTGHMLGAAGAVEAIVAVKAITDGVIPPTINYQVKDEECDLNITPNVAVKADIKASLSTSLGFGGHNACVAFKKI